MKFYKIFYNFDDADEKLIILYVTLDEKSFCKDFFIVDSDMHHVELQEIAESKLQEFYQSLTQQEVTS